MALPIICRTTQVLRSFQFSRCSLSFVTEKYLENVQLSPSSQSLQCKYFCDQRKSNAPTKPPGPNDPQKPKKHKPLTSCEITLILPEGTVMSVTKEHAEKMSKRRNLKLVNIIDFDTKTERPIYKLMTSAEFFELDNEAKVRRRREKDSAVKEAKIFTISSKITEHDLHNKINQMMRLLKKRHEVRVSVSIDGNPPRADEIVKTINEYVKDLITKSNQVTKNLNLKLYFIPKMDAEKEQSSDNETVEKKAQA